MSDHINFDLYTDGACSGNPGPGGWAVWGRMYVLDSEYSKEFKLTGHETDTTNNRMELTAFAAAYASAIRHLSDGDCDDVTIYTDSSYVYNALTQGWLATWSLNKWKNKSNTCIKNSDLWKNVLRLLASPHAQQITVKKVRGHVGCIGNEKADALAVFERDKAIEELIASDSGYVPPKNYVRGRGYKQSYIYKYRKAGRFK